MRIFHKCNKTRVQTLKVTINKGTSGLPTIRTFCTCVCYL